jgi:hypothetical protein
MDNMAERSSPDAGPEPLGARADLPGAARAEDDARRHDHPPRDDDRLLDEAAAVLRDLRRRAPDDFLTSLSLLLGAAVVLLLTVGLVIADGPIRDITLNLAGEVFGAWLTVVLIGGLWRRLELRSEREFALMSRAIEGRRNRPLTGEERRAWSLLVDVYRDAEPALTVRNPVRYLAALARTMRRMRVLDREGNRTFERFAREIRRTEEEPGSPRAHPWPVQPAAPGAPLTPVPDSGPGDGRTLPAHHSPAER